MGVGAIVAGRKGWKIREDQTPAVAMKVTVGLGTEEGGVETPAGGGWEVTGGILRIRADGSGEGDPLKEALTGDCVAISNDARAHGE